MKTFQAYVWFYKTSMKHHLGLSSYTINFVKYGMVKLTVKNGCYQGCSFLKCHAFVTELYNKGKQALASCKCIAQIMLQPTFSIFHTWHIKQKNKCMLVMIKKLFISYMLLGTKFAWISWGHQPLHSAVLWSVV